MRRPTRLAGIVVGALLVATLGSADVRATGTACRWQTMRVERGVEWLGVAETKPHDVWLAGNRWLDKKERKGRATVEHWDGKRWRLESLPSNVGAGVGGDVGAFGGGPGGTGVAAATPVNAWTLLRTPDADRIAHWNGRRWSFAGPPLRFPAPEVQDLAALPRGAVWAVGESGIALHWDGRQWQKLRLPGGSGKDYRTVVPLADKDVWALGLRNSPKGWWRTLASHWDGKLWRVVPTPDLVNDGGRSEDVGEWFKSGYVGRDGFVYATVRTGGGRLLVERWNGQAWKIIPLHVRQGEMDSIVVRSVSDAWAAYDPSTDNRRPRLYHWNGRIWSTVALPTPLRRAHELWLSGRVAGEAWAFATRSASGNGDASGTHRLMIAMRLRCGT